MDEASFAIDVESIASICHEANRQYCAELGDFSQLAWNEAAAWQRESAISGVKARVANPGQPPSTSHERWMAHKLAEGWQYGPIKDADKKEHPCLMHYEHLPVSQQRKDYLFTAIIDALKPMLDQVD